MSITDELRAWAKEHLSRSRILAIADRIDAEHEAQLNDAFETRNSDENLESDGWMRLPKDADGEYIHVGDSLKDGAEFKSEGVVECLMLDESGWFVGFGNGWTDVTIHEWHHHHAPTVEDVLEEFVARWLETHHDDLPSLKAEYAAKLRLKEDA